MQQVILAQGAQLLREAASDLLKQTGCQFVIMGHTHESVDDEHYKNTGSWTRYWQMNPGDAPSWEAMVILGAQLPMALRYALVHDDPGLGVTLEVFTPAP